MQAGLCAIRFKMSDSLQVFNRRIVRRHRDRAAARLSEHDFLFVESADRLVNRLGDVTRIFPLALDLGCHGGELARALAGTGKVATLVKADLSPAMAARAKPLATAADEELLPFADGVFDLVVSNLNLHWVNDLPGALAQILRTLKPDGLFLAAVLAGKTLIELRHALSEAEIIEESMKKQNRFNFELIDGNILQPLKITSIQPNGFQDYMKSIGKLGGQNKVQRLANDRKVADGLQPFKIS